MSTKKSDVCMNLGDHSNEPVAEMFNDYFTSIANELKMLMPQQEFDISKLKSFVPLRKPDAVNFCIPPIVESFILQNLHSMKCSKAAGFDKISVRMLKIAAPVIVPSLAKLMNISISSTVFPQRWKTAKVTPIYKSGDRTDTSNYRPISVLPALSKILERHVHVNLYNYFIQNKLLYSQQSGFRKYHNTETALIRIVDQLLRNLDENHVSGLLLIDYRKAFDIVDHEILMLKLGAYGLSASASRWFASYLERRRQGVSIDGKVSNWLEVPHGVPQGSILGPLLFIIYINDLPLHVLTDDVDLDLYADDTTIMTAAPIHSIQTDLENTLNRTWQDVETWANTNKLPLNQSKTKTLLITGKRLAKKISSEDTKLSVVTNEGITLEQVETAKLLGLELDSELSFSSHVDKLCRKLAQRIGVLNKIKSCLPVKQRILYYNALIRSLMSYVSVVWHTCSKQDLGKVFLLQKRAGRVILDAKPRTSSVTLFN